MSDYEFPPLLDPRESQSDSVLRLFAWWNSNRPVGLPYPKWSEVEIVELRDWTGWLMVYGLLPDCSDAEYRLVGGQIVEKAGYDLTGTTVSKATYTLRPDLVLQNLRRICLYGGACLQTNELEVNSGGFVRSHERLWMPFAEDGETVNRLLLYHHSIKVLDAAPIAPGPMVR
ncbi:MAG: hypothetical protein NXI19_05465 [Alphaproteobacteria bacterium]|nr:hypothetical protein [Alphaproteobacteria bacterium]